MLNKAKTDQKIQSNKLFKITTIPEISILNDISQMQKSILAFISQLDNDFGCTAMNNKIMQHFQLSRRMIQYHLAKLKKLGYITRHLKNGFQRTMHSIFANLYKFKKVARGGAMDCTNNRDIDSSLSQDVKNQKINKVKELLEQELTEVEQVDYNEYISKKPDYNQISVLNTYYHKGWLKWFKFDLEIKRKGKMYADRFRNMKSSLIGKFSSKNSNQNQMTNYQLNEKRNQILQNV